MEITLTTQEVEVFFKDFLQEFYKEFQKENEIYKITLKDVPKIKKINESSFIHVRERFIETIRTKMLTTVDFYNLFIVGLQLLPTDDDIVKLYLKSQSTKHKEEYFKKLTSSLLKHF